MSKDRTRFRELKEAQNVKFSITSSLSFANDLSFQQCCVLPDARIATIQLNTLCIYDTVKQNLIKKINLPANCHEFTASPDGRILCNYEDNVHVFDSISLEEIGFPLGDLRLNNAVWIGHHLICTKNLIAPKTIFVWDFSKPQPTLTTSIDIATEFGIRNLAAFSNGELAYSESRIINILKNSGDKFEKITKLYPGPVAELIAQKSNPMIATLPNDKMISIENRNVGHIKIWDANHQCTTESTNSIASRLINKLRLLPDEATLISFGNHDNELCIWDLQTLTPSIIKFQDIFRINDFDILPNGNLVLATSDGIVVARLRHIVEHKLKIVVRTLIDVMAKDPAGLVAHYIGDDVDDIKVDVKQMKELKNYPVRLFTQQTPIQDNKKGDHPKFCIN